MSLNNYKSYHNMSIEQIRNYCKPYVKDEIVELSINLIVHNTYSTKLSNDFYFMPNSNYDFVFHKSLNKLKEFYYENFT